jgi:transposase
VTRVAVALSCSAEQRTELMNLARSRTEEARMVERAKIVLACLQGKRNDEVSRELGVRPNTVGLWRKRFAARGLAGLRDQPRPGKKPKYGAELRQRILWQLELPPPPGLAGWDGGTLAAALGVTDAAVWRVLRKEGIQLRRRRSWCVSTDPQFATKAANIIGLYLNPPENALVLSVDEKPSIQALERATGYVQTSSGKIVQGLKSTYTSGMARSTSSPLWKSPPGSSAARPHRPKSASTFKPSCPRSLQSSRPTAKSTSSSTTTAPIRKTKLGSPLTPMSRFTSPRLQRAGLTRWKSGLVSLPVRPCPGRAFAVPSS